MPKAQFIVRFIDATGKEILTLEGHDNLSSIANTAQYAFRDVPGAVRIVIDMALPYSKD